MRMDEWCPLCLKMGNKKRIRTAQINFSEAVRLCEDEGCLWPFGYKEFEFVPRTLEELSKTLPPKRKRHKRKKAVLPKPISPGLVVYTPPTTPSNDGSSKDNGKIDNPARITNNFNGKISPNYSLNTAQPIEREYSKNSADKHSYTLKMDPVPSIFDVDSPIPMIKVEILPINNDTSDLKPDTRPKIHKKGPKKCPRIRRIETIPSNVLKIAMKEDPQAINALTDISDDKSRLKTSKIETNKGPLENLDSIYEIPKKILKVADGEGILTQTSAPQFSTIISQAESKVGVESQSNNFVEMINFETEKAAVENSMYINVDGIFDDIVNTGCNNVTEEINDDWLNSFLL